MKKSQNLGNTVVLKGHNNEVFLLEGRKAVVARILVHPRTQTDGYLPPPQRRS